MSIIHFFQLIGTPNFYPGFRRRAARRAASLYHPNLTTRQAAARLWLRVYRPLATAATIIFGVALFTAMFAGLLIILALVVIHRGL